MAEPASILFCNCTYAQVVPPEVKATVLQKLCDSGVAFEAVADLCELSARHDPVLQRLADCGGLKIAACFPRAVKWLFAAGGAPLPRGSTEVLNMRVQRADEVVESLFDPVVNANLPDGRQAPSTAELPPPITAAVVLS